MSELLVAVDEEEKVVEAVADGAEDVVIVPKTTVKNKKTRFLGRAYLIYVGVLVLLSLCAVLYVQRVLAGYEAAQPDNVVQTYLTNLQKAAKRGKVEKIVSLDGVKAQFSPTDAQLTAYMGDLAAGELSFRETESDTLTLNYDLFCDNYKIGDITLKYEGQETKLLIFTTDLWEIERSSLTEFRFDVTLPSTVLPTQDGQKVEGTVSEDGRTVTYAVSSLTVPNIVLTDLLGNTKSYSQCGECDFEGYTVSVPSNFTLKGKETVPVSSAILTQPDAYKYLSEYCAEAPKQAEYNVRLVDDKYDLSLFDNLGNPVDISQMGDTISITKQTATDTLPQTIENAPDPLELAKMWSLFMTRDLSGTRYGFYRLEEYLIKDSYLRQVAWKWATGVDITFTSRHTLGNPPFQVAEVSNFVTYGTNAFSCDIHLEKQLRLTATGAKVNDVINSTFYFVYYDDTDNGKDDPHWAIADKQDIAQVAE